MPVGFGRGGEDESTVTGHEAGGGRTATNEAGEGRPRGRGRARRERRSGEEREKIKGVS